METENDDKYEESTCHDDKKYIKKEILSAALTIIVSGHRSKIIKIVKSKIGIVQSIFYIGNVEMTDGMVLMANIMSDIFHYIS